MNNAAVQQLPTRFDVCVAGAGGAGIIAALELARLKPDCQFVLVEFGYANQGADNELDDSIAIPNLQNHHPPYECTNKGLGGTTATWGGRCVMYDEIDFIPRPVIGDTCTWDIQLYREIQSDIQTTQSYFESGNGPFQLPSSLSPIAEDFQSDEIVDTVLERWSMPTRFGNRYRKELESTQNLLVLEGYEARGFDVDNGIASAVQLRDRRTGQPMKLFARKFVIAAGAQESTRLLLRSKNLFAKLGKIPKALGKFYQGHVSGKIATIKFNGSPRKTEYGFQREADGTYIRRRFQFTTDALQRHNLLNTAFWLDNPLYVDPNHRSGAMSLMYLAMITPILGKKLAPPAIAHSVTKGKVNQVGSHIWNVVRGLPNSVVVPANTFWQRYCRKRKLPGVFLFNPRNEYALHFHAEQIPVDSNCMELGTDDSLTIHYELHQDDIDSVIRSHEILDRELQKNGCGKLEYWYPQDELANEIRKMSRDGVHQCGTTRIGDSPERGVVDRDLRVWGTDNVYVCSSSVFPTSGQANPTFLIGVFAVRLARHLAESLRATN